jgi:hypothetical protein
VAGVYVGVLVVALLRFVATGNRRLIPVLLLFLLLLVAHTRPPWSPWTSLWHLAAGFAGLAVVLAIAPIPPRR